MPGHPVRLAQRVDGVAGQVGDGLAGQLVRGAAVELEVARQRPGVGAGLGQRLADVAGLEPRQLLGALLDQPADPRQQAAALGGGRPAPVAGERGAGGSDRRVDLAGAAAGDPADLAAVRRILRRQRPRCRGHPGAPDQAAVAHPAISRIGAAAMSSRV